MNKNYILVLPIILFISSIIYTIYILKQPSIWKTEIFSDVSIKPSKETKSSLERSKRESSRGTLFSIGVAYITIISLIISKRLKIQNNDITIKIGLILLPIVNFIFDLLFSTDKGLYLYMNSRDEGWMYVWRSLASPIFYRYMITVLLDLFISKPMLDTIEYGTKDIVKSFIINNNKNKLLRNYIKGVGMNFDIISYIIIQLLTFNAYTNQSRFNWAYNNSDSAENSETIKTGPILLVCGVATGLYLTYTSKGASSTTTRLYFTMTMLCLLSIGYLNNLLDPKYDKDPIDNLTDPKYDKDKDSSIFHRPPYQYLKNIKMNIWRKEMTGETKMRNIFWKEYAGFSIFLIFVIVCGIIPIYNSQVIKNVLVNTNNNVKNNVNNVKNSLIKNNKNS